MAGPCPPVPAETGGWNAKALQLFDDIAAQGEKVNLISYEIQFSKL